MADMINMKNIASSEIAEIPEAWIYRYYAEKHGRPIHQPLDGRTIKIRSFNNRDSNPSLCLFYKADKKRYYWKDHSSGVGGGAVDFVAHIIGKEYAVAHETILREYDKFIEEGGNLDEYDNHDKQIQAPVRYEGKIKSWDGETSSFWTQYQISLDTLCEYNVVPLEYYDRLVGDGTYYRSLGKGKIYGYFSVDKGLYQIYQPGNEKAKYLNNKTDYITGMEQLKKKSKTLIIMSGLKDIMAFRELKLDAEAIASKSESTLLSAQWINFFKSIYPNVITMLDNDKTGINAMRTYRAMYDLPMVHVPLEKDMADNCKRHNLQYLQGYYTYQINKAINSITNGTKEGNHSSVGQCF